MLAVLFLDLDRFKHINDSRGHEVGDKLLQEIAKRVRAAVRPADIVVRMGGDEFVVVLHKVNSPDEVGIAATRINEVLSAPVMIDGRALVATVSIGVSLYPARRRHHGRTAQAFGHGDVPGEGSGTEQLPGVLAADGPRRSRNAWPSNRPCASGSSSTSSTCTTSPSSTSIRGASPASRRCCAGSIRRRDTCRPNASSKWPKRPASSFPSASSCSTASAATSPSGASRARTWCR